MTLKELAIGKTAVVKSVGGEGALRQHFLDMGVIPGAEVTVVKLAPMGDPIELNIHGYELTLRLADAAQIGVEPVATSVKEEKKPGRKKKKREREEISEEELKEEKDTLTEVFRKALGRENLEVKVEKLKNENISSMMTLSEENRRMQDMMKMYGMGGMDPSMFGGQETLVLNANNKLVQYIFENKDSEHVPMICGQLYDLAMLSHKQLAPEQMTKFIARSNEILALLTK